MPSRAYTNADVNRQYGRGRHEFGAWTPLRRDLSDPAEGLGDENIDDIIAESKNALARADAALFNVKNDVVTPQSARMLDRQDAQMRELEYDRAEQDARDASSYWGVAKRTADAAAVPLSFYPPTAPFAGTYLAARGVEDAVESPSALTLGFAGLGALPFARPIAKAISGAKEAAMANRVRQATGSRMPFKTGQSSPWTSPVPAPRPMRAIASRVEGAYGTDAGRREALDPATWDGIATDAPMRRTAGPSVVPEQKAPAFGTGLGRLRPRETPTVEEALTNVLEEARQMRPEPRASFMPTAGEVVPKSGTASGAESLARRAEQARRPYSPLASLRQEPPTTAAPRAFDLDTMDDPMLSVIDDTAPQPHAYQEPAATWGDQVPRRGAAMSDVDDTIAEMQRGLGRLPNRNRGAQQALGGEAPLPRGAAPLQPQTDPSRMLPAFGETHEGMAGQRLGVGNSRTRTLRPESTTMELANELAESEGLPRVKALSAFPRPTGSDELSKALRQRGYLSEKSRNLSDKAGPNLRDERGFVIPEGLIHATSTGAGALAGGANPELVGADPDSHLEGAAYGGLYGMMAPGAVRGLGRIARAIPRGAKATGAQAFDEVQDLRYQGGLSGWAALKSMIGNVGSGIATSAEQGSIAPLRSLLSKQTGRDWLARFRDPKLGQQTIEEVERAPNLFGRIMGAGDYATAQALGRSGSSTKAIERATLRTPTAELFGSDSIPEAVLKSRLGKAGMLFQTTPINQIMHGANTAVGHKLPDGLSVNRTRAIASIAAGLGAAQGYRDESDPLEIALTAPLTGVYSAPYLAGAAGGMVARGATSLSRGVLRGVSPVPELGADIIDPRKYFRPITDPAIGAWFKDEPQTATQRRTTRTRAKRARLTSN